MKQFLLTVSLLACGCATQETPAGMSEEPGPARKSTRHRQSVAVAGMSPVTILPDVFVVDQGRLGAGNLKSPPNSLMVAAVGRPRADLREGPGTSFELTDATMVEGEKVLVLESRGVWRKVLSLGSDRAGWLHSGMLREPTVNQEPVSIRIDRMPLTMAVRPVHSIDLFPRQESVAVEIPKGKLFRLLRRDGDRLLVWIPETNSPAWVSGKDVQ